MLVQEQLVVGDTTLDVRIATPSSRANANHVLVICHGLPRTLGMGRQAAALLPELAEHLANESGWLVVSGSLSGVGSSTGNFSMSTWRRDLAAIIDRIDEPDRRISIAGFGFGGVLAIAQASRDERIKGVATFATTAHLDQWAGSAEVFHGAVRRAGVVHDEATMLSADALHRDLMTVDVLEDISHVPPRRLLIVHGSDDVEVSEEEARELVAAAEGRAELRIIQGCAHQMRADPRMVATLLGWLDRHR